MKLSGVILTALDAAGGSLPGRTRLQKVVYFICERLSIDAAYFPHYYGPYSEEVAGAVDSLVARGLVEEEVDPGATGGQYEGRVYTYSLTEAGKELTRVLEESDPSEVRSVREEFAELLCNNPSTQTLAVASKLHILMPPSGTVTSGQLRENARERGWGLRGDEVEAGIDFLVTKGFAESD